jgi:uncharacterized peroxidase-related enzyme
VVQHGAALAREDGEPALTEAVVSADLDALPERLRELCRYAWKLTLTPWGMTEGDLAALRRFDLSDRDIVDLNQVVAYYNYVNRVADGLGVELEDDWPAQSRQARRYPVRSRLRPD